jgi:hypothetical protein
MSSTLYPTNNLMTFKINNNKLLRQGRTKFYWMIIVFDFFLAIPMIAGMVAIATDSEIEYDLLVIILIWIVLNLVSIIGVLLRKDAARKTNIVLVMIIFSAFYIFFVGEGMQTNTLFLSFALISMMLSIQIYALSFHQPTVNIFSQNKLYLERISEEIEQILQKNQNTPSSRQLSIEKPSIQNVILNKTKLLRITIFINCLLFVFLSCVYFWIFRSIEVDSIFEIIAPIYISTLLFATLGVSYFHKGARDLNIVLLVILLIAILLSLFLFNMDVSSLLIWLFLISSPVLIQIYTLGYHKPTLRLFGNEGLLLQTIYLEILMFNKLTVAANYE